MPFISEAVLKQSQSSDSIINQLLFSCKVIDISAGLPFSEEILQSKFQFSMAF